MTATMSGKGFQAESYPCHRRWWRTRLSGKVNNLAMQQLRGDGACFRLGMVRLDASRSTRYEWASHTYWLHESGGPFGCCGTEVLRKPWHLGSCPEQEVSARAPHARRSLTNDI